MPLPNTIFVSMINGIEAYVTNVGLNSIYFETIEKLYKYYTNFACPGLRLFCGVAG